MTTTQQTKLFARVNFYDGCKLICTFEELAGILPFEEYRSVDHVQMTQREYDALPEFEG